MADALWLARRLLLEHRPADPVSDEPRPKEPPAATERPSGPPPDTTSNSVAPPDVGAREPDLPVDSDDIAGESRGVDPPRHSATAAAVLDGDQPRVDSGIPRALRPLRLVIRSATELELDEEATAERAVVDRRWLPVRRPAEELRWDVVLVVDDSPSMALWWSTALEFAGTLSRQGAFRNVQVRLLGSDESGRLTVRSTVAGALRHGISEVIDPSRRRIVLVLSDTAAETWRSGSAFAALRVWGTAHPVALVHVLPWHTWHQAGIELHRVRLRAREPGAPNSSLDWMPQAAAPDLFDDLDDVVPIGVVELNSAGLSRWVRMTTATGAGWTDMAALLVPPRPMVEAGSVFDVPPTPERLVSDFRATASPVAYELATYLAAAPLELDVMRRVRAELLPASDTVHLAEVLGSRLVAPVAPSGQVSSDRVTFEFAPGVRAELLAAGRRVSTARVRRVVRDCVGAQAPEVHEFYSGLDEVAGRTVRETDVSALTEFFLDADLAVLGALSGIHLVEARQLRRVLKRTDIHSKVAGADPELSDASPLLQESDDAPHSVGVRVAGQSSSGEVKRHAGGTEVTTTADRDTEATQSPQGAPPLIWGGVPPRNANFTGRDDLLHALDERLEPGATAAVLPEALHGLGGVGKSQLAIEYAYRYQSKFDVIWWIPAERSVQIANALVELGQRLNLRAGAAANIAVQPVLDALRGGGHRKIPPNWLLVFDNADNPATVLPYLPTGGPGRILVTSRNSQWLSIARPLEVDVFRRQESVQLLQRRGPELTDDEAGRLAEALGDLPLAIAQAAAWRAETGMPADEYLELLAEKQVELLSVPGALDYPTSVAAAWNLSLEQLEKKNPSALRILQTCAFFAPEPVAKSMFTNGRGAAVEPGLQRALRDRLRLNEAIRDINRYALARIDHRTNSIEMHRLVQAVLVGQMTEAEQDRSRHDAHLLLGANDPNAPDDRDYWTKYTELNAHILKSNAIECEEQSVRDLVFNQAKFLYYWGDHEASCDLSQRIYDIWCERLGPDHLETLKVGRWLGFMRWVLGRYAQAAELNDAILAAYRRTVGDAHEDTIEAIGAVAADNRAKGDFATALELSEGNYRRCVRSFGDEDPVALNAAHNLGVSLRLAGDFSRALKLDEETWGLKVQTFGSEHPLALITQVGLTIDRRETGDYRGARLAHEEIVATYRRQHEALNPATLRAVRHLAVMRRKAGDHERALTASEEALRGLTARYGPDHADTLAAALSKSIDLRHLKDISGAAKLARQTLERYQRALGPDHPHTLSAAVNVAIVRRFLGDNGPAEELDRATVEGFRARLGEDHPSTLVAMVNLASDRAALGLAQAAYELGLSTAERAERVLGADHPTTLACRANLAQDLGTLGSVAEAARMRAEVIERLRRQLGGQHPVVSQLSDPNARADCDIDPMPL
ncbi:tetratricopeptide repeat protein [Solihabitans fulvus]|uniref:Tetratricopeptide repeat protein n=1 Tax=Solihabitans fulvus TaxID=1892852 RepID=A0A5B2XMN3_9PSEU|nr:FxSxx-COOH system tetratricopeptide repeat protein [Solihabitans fulvus]KAA2265118.1 tetratricopeptide repeat protein [Solihabitans fulvus]